MAIRTKKELLDVLAKANFKPRKSLGQNFLIDPNFLNFIVRSANISPSDHILEIGAGAGILTKLLAQKAKKVTALEIDESIFEICKNNLSGFDNVVLFNEDAIKALDKIKIQKVKVISNLPYSNYSKILLELFSSRIHIEDAFILVQLEVYNKLKEQSAIGEITRALYDIKFIRAVPPDAFYPKPNVQSALINLTPKKRSLISNEEVKPIYAILKSLLTQRRRKIRSALKNPAVLQSDLLERRICELYDEEIISLARKFI